MTHFFFFLLHMPSDSQDGSSNLLIDTKDRVNSKGNLTAISHNFVFSEHNYTTRGFVTAPPLRGIVVSFILIAETSPD